MIAYLKGFHAAKFSSQQLRFCSQPLMDSLFLLGDGDRATYLQQMVQAFNCTYICLWSYLPEPNCLLCLDGLYREPANQANARRLFNAYRQLPLGVDNGSVPGLAFKNHYPYMKLEMADLVGLASTETQLQFYQEAGIKTVVFMGCNAGEIEFGISNDAPVNLEMELKTWFLEHFSQKVAPAELPLPHDQNRPSSSSSSLRSLSVDSSEYSPLLFNIPSSAYIPEPAKEALGEQTMGSAPPSTAATSPRRQTIQALSQIRNIQFPSIESEDAALTKAMLAVISSPPSSTSPQSEQKFPPQRPPAFQNYRSFAGSAHKIPPAAAGTTRPNMFRRAVTFYRNLSLLQRQAGQVQGSRPTSTQLHHMISERRRREKLNESFQALRSLLPPGTKKDKASVLAKTTEYLSSLKAQVAELNKRNQILEAQVLPPPGEDKAATIEQASGGSSSSTERRVQVRTRHVEASTSEARIVDLQVDDVRGQCNILDLAICILEFLKHVNNISVVSIDANTRIVASSSSPVNRVMLRLRIEGGEWDESAFQEAVRRVVDDLAQ